MMSTVIAFVVALATASGGWHRAESDALRQTAPHELAVPGSAAVHLAAATLAGDAFSVDPALLLSIAWHESRYEPGAVTRERSGKLSCGLMMVTEPLGEACPEPSVLWSYLGGASHLHVWMKLCRGNRTCALRGYAGGFWLQRRCERDGSYFVRDGVDACDVDKMFGNRAAWITRALQHAHQEASS